jgi:uncharacterized protein
MVSLQRYLGRDADFYAQLIRSTDNGIAALGEARAVAAGGEPSRAFAALAALERATKEAEAAIRAYQVQTFITPIEREDISAMSQSLSRLTKLARKFAQHFSLSPERLRGFDFEPSLACAQRAAALISEMLRAMQAGGDPAQIRTLADRFAPIDDDAHRALVALKQRLYGEPIEPVTAICLNDVLGLLDKLNDGARDAVALLHTVLVKNA